MKLEIEDKWQIVQTGSNKSYQRKVVRIIRDNEGTTLTIYKLTNNHNELEIKKKGKEVQVLLEEVEVK